MNSKIHIHPFSISVTHNEATLRHCATTTLHPKGRIDRNSAHVFQAWLMNIIRDDADAVTIDFAAVDHIDSAGLSALMTAVRKAQGAEVWFGVSNLQPSVNEVFEISRCKIMIAVFGTVQLQWQDKAA
ncbi:MAG: STAS domain-containing protein [Alphaproteobacteria bacterium]|nr:STAS domain-containing protein [Alphaproteobacteria bacterium]